MAKRHYSWEDVAKGYAKLRRRDFDTLSEREKHDVERYVCDNNFDLNNRADVDFVVDAYIAERLDVAPLLANAKADGPERATGQTGSLQTLVAYARLQPLVLKAREAVTGTATPLDAACVLEWLRREATKAGALTYKMHRLSCDYVVLASKEEEWGLTVADLENETEAKREVFDTAQKCNEKIADMPPSYYYPRVKYVTKYILRANADGKVENIPLETETLIKLAAWAELLIEEYPPLHFKEAVTLILSGLMQPAGLSLGLKRATFPSATEEWEEGAGFELDARGSPYIQLIVDSMELSPKELGEQYARLRKSNGFGGQGRSLTREAEVLGLAAMHLIWVEGREKKGQAFYEQARELYRDWARSYRRLDPNHYHEYEDGKPKSWQAVSKALARIEDAHKAFYLSYFCSDGFLDTNFVAEVAKIRYPLFSRQQVASYSQRQHL